MEFKQVPDHYEYEDNKENGDDENPIVMEDLSDEGKIQDGKGQDLVWFGIFDGVFHYYNFEYDDTLNEDDFKEMYAVWNGEKSDKYEEVESVEDGDGSWTTKVKASGEFDYIIRLRRGYVSYPVYLKKKGA